MDRTGLDMEIDVSVDLVASSYCGVRSHLPSAVSPGLYRSIRTHPEFFMCRWILSFSSTFVPRSAMLLSDYFLLVDLLPSHS